MNNKLNYNAVLFLDKSSSHFLEILLIFINDAHMHWGAILRLLGLMGIEAQKEVILNVSFEEIEAFSYLFSNKQLNAIHMVSCHAYLEHSQQGNTALKMTDEFHLRLNRLPSRPIAKTHKFSVLKHIVIGHQYIHWRKCLSMLNHTVLLRTVLL